MEDLYPVIRPQQPLRPFWMGDDQRNEHWEVIQGDALAYFIEMFCDCPMVPDITSFTFFFCIKASLDPNDPNILLQTIWSELHGVCGYTALIVMPYETAAVPAGCYAFDLKYRTRGGMVQTIRRGQIDVLNSTNLTMSGFYDIPPPIPGGPLIPTGLKADVRRQSAHARLTN